MKKLVLLLTVISFTAISTMAAEPLLLEPLQIEGNVSALSAETSAQTQNAIPATAGSFEATFTPASNMVPQNAAAEGKPVPKKKAPRVRIQTKQGSQGNTQWNPGGKGTKAFF